LWPNKWFNFNDYVAGPVPCNHQWNKRALHKCANLDLMIVLVRGKP
jgi:hypothetical protein